MLSGDMHYMVAFERPTSVPDGMGGTSQGWSEVFRAAAAIMFLRGGETVQAARLAGRQPAVVTIWAGPEARQITPSWRMVDTRSGMVYNVRAIVPTDDRAMIEITAESGVGT